MSTEKALALLDQAQAAIAAARQELGPAAPPPPVPIATPDAFDRALATAAAGDVIVVSSLFIYRAPVTLRLPIMLRSEVAGSGRMSLDAPAPKFLSGITVAADHVSLVGLEVRHANRMAAIVDITGKFATLDRCRVLGDPASGQKRGVAINGAVCSVTRCYVEDCWGPYPGDDTQAIYGQDTPGPILIEDCYLSGGTETVMFGGGDPTSNDRVPADIRILDCTITKRPEWQQQQVSVKNTLELKNAKRVTITGNIIEQSWGGHGQDGYLIMLTPRNQGGSAPYSTVEDVEIAHNTCRHGAAAISILGDDNNKPSQRLSRVTIHDNTFADLDPVAYAGSKRLILIQRGPRDVSIVNNTFAGQNLTSSVYFAGQPKCEQLTVTGNRWPKTRYGVFGDGASVGKAWDQYVASGQFADNVET